MKDDEKYVSGEQFNEMKNRRKTKKTNSYQRPILIVIGILVVAGLGFYGGVQYGKAHDRNTSTSTQARTGTGGFFSRYGGQRPTFGQVTAVSSTSISVDTQGGSTTTYSINSTTTITDSGQTTTASDIQVGDTVAVIPSTSSSSEASRILVNPSFGGFGGGGSTQSTGGTTD